MMLQELGHGGELWHDKDAVEIAKVKQETDALTDMVGTALRWAAVDQQEFDHQFKNLVLQSAPRQVREAARIQDSRPLSAFRDKAMWSGGGVLGPLPVSHSPLTPPARVAPVMAAAAPPPAAPGRLRRVRVMVKSDSEKDLGGASGSIPVIQTKAPPPDTCSSCEDFDPSSEEYEASPMADPSPARSKRFKPEPDADSVINLLMLD
jgi:hypothetical protein